MRAGVVVKFQFEGIHCWPACPFEDVAFLKEPHRHIFHVTASKAVSHEHDREVEIIRLKRLMQTDDLITSVKLGSMSCEKLAMYFLEKFKLESCYVLEDGENGAYVAL